MHVQIILMTFIEAKTSDNEQMLSVRLSMKENKLSNPELINLKDYEEYSTK